MQLMLDNPPAPSQECHAIDGVLLGHSAAMREVRRRVLRLADTGADVMIHGETGTGKEVIARCLHNYSRRRSRNFVAINCGGLPDALFESELFGHEAGAFTSAAKRRVGKIEHADGGTLLLDEIESMPIPLQIKLLRVLQERKIERLGANDLVPVNLRVIGATKADLLALIAQQRFRSDLYYRLNVVVVHLPPLRERRDDIPMLFAHFVAAARTRFGLSASEPGSRYLRELIAHDWPGNVRELRNAADRFVLEGDDGPLAPSAKSPSTLAQQMDMIEKAFIERALHRHQGHVSKVSEALGVARKTLYDKVNRYGIDPNRYRT